MYSIRRGPPPARYVFCKKARLSLRGFSLLKMPVRMAQKPQNFSKFIAKGLGGL